MLMRKLFKKYLLTRLLPPLCIVCGLPSGNTHSFCDACTNSLPILPQSCEQCAQFLPIKAAKCGYCLSSPPDFQQTFALFPYEQPISQLITKLKFQYQLHHAESLGELMAKRVKNTWYADKTLPDLIIPIPLHPQRLRERGFNQALEIAKPVAKALKIPLDRYGTRRVKTTIAQSGLTKKDRKRNIAGAFDAIHDYSDLKIALIDDVITTGYTVRECSAMLKKQGAAHIDVWCCARNG